MDVRESSGAGAAAPDAGIALDVAAERRVAEVVRQYWGFEGLRPLQREAIAASLAGRDSLVVMPTGGGKSLCYQVPPLVTGRMSVVVSPLIALMRDQVDGLRLAGYPAAALHSNLTEEEKRAIRAQVRAGELRLLFAAPERLLSAGFLSWLREVGVGSIAIDEAHCISQWGHDFRPEYRRLAELRTAFPEAALHAYTATATERVREDIVEQLGLRAPVELVGRFDRPNLTYRVLPRMDLVGQVCEALARHKGEAAIVYCISRKDTESLAASLVANGFDARAYHAGMGAAERTRVGADFRAERLDIVVATVAFGMGIDRGDVRCVIHAAMPKTVEHYQQETGRAGRDGLPSECVLLHSGGDAQRWRRLMEASAAESGDGSEALEAQLGLLAQMQRVCSAARCRHRALSEHFGQEYEPPEGREDCGACDVCLGELEEVEGSTEIALKILSCVARVREMFGGAHVNAVLRGRATAKVREKGHETLSTFGLLAGMTKEAIDGYIGQLVDQGFLAVAEGQFPTLSLTPSAAEAMRGRREVSLRRAGAAHAVRAVDGPTTLEGPEHALFEALRKVRREIAEELGVPPYVVFGDQTLVEMSQRRPGSERALLGVKGVGQVKLKEFGERFLGEIRAKAGELGLAMDARGAAAGSWKTVKRSQRADEAARLFRAGKSIDEVAAEMGTARSTAAGRLADYIVETRPSTIEQWVDARTYSAVREAAGAVGAFLLRPIYERLGERVPYEEIRMTLAHVRAMEGGAGASSRDSAEAE